MAIFLSNVLLLHLIEFRQYKTRWNFMSCNFENKRSERSERIGAEKTRRKCVTDPIFGAQKICVGRLTAAMR